MSWDIYGNPLRRGHCEAHPHVHEEYPCSICIAQKQQQSQPHNKLEQLQYELDQQGDYIRHLELERAALVAQVAGRDALLNNLSKWIDRLPVPTKSTTSWLMRIDGVMKESPNQHLRQIQADAGRSGYLIGIQDWRYAELKYQNFNIEKSADNYAASVKAGEV